MNRCLHISLHERPEGLPRRAATPLAGWTGSSPDMGRHFAPRTDHDTLKPDDPDIDDSVHEPRDPPAYLKARSSNPSYADFPSDSSDGDSDGVVAATVRQGPLAPGTATPHPFIGPRDYSGFVIVRMAPGIESEEESLWELAQHHTPKLPGLQAVLELPSEGILVSRPLVELHESPVGCEEPLATKPLSRRQVLDSIHALEKRTAVTAFPPLHSLTSYWRLDLREHPGLVQETVAQLNRLVEVDLAYRELAATDPKAADGWTFVEDQGYCVAAPVGIGAAWARAMAMRAPHQPVTLCDLEQGWNFDHQDLIDTNNQPLVNAPSFGVNRTQDGTSSGHHGTAVLGQLAARDNSLGVTGLVTDLCQFVVASHYAKDHTNGHVTSAMVQALSSATTLGSPLQRGDILLLEVQRDLLPVEIDEVDLDAIRLASGLGILVIEAAGNGGYDLDAYSHPETGRSLRPGHPGFRDSGAILVGAARAALPHDRALFSNYGSRLDCYGWGEGVTTCGYGDLAGAGPAAYTNSFSGTSSASPIIAGAAALLQILHEAHTGKRLKPQAMRGLLADPATGTRQGPNVAGHIGVLPDLEAIIRGRLQIVPDVYMRRSVGDDGSPPTPTDEISSSPDILVSSAGNLTTVRNLFGAGGPGENHAAPGDPVASGKLNKLYVRLHNRGLGEGKVHVQLFASPAATLITPELWIPAGEPMVSPSIPQGDTLVVAGPGWTPPPTNQNHTSSWSFLALLAPLGEEPAPLGPPWSQKAIGLPPGPPSFDWAEYRAFLRGPRVAWRNTHRATAGPLPFFITGTPDLARSFAFEVIQRLPAGATVTLRGPDALAAKLRQHQPWLDKLGQPSLPQRPRTTIRGVELAAGACIPATFTVKAGGSPLTAGHSLAIRQLWRGEEVGRITWIFDPNT